MGVGDFINVYYSTQRPEINVPIKLLPFIESRNKSDIVCLNIKNFKYIQGNIKEESKIEVICFSGVADDFSCNENTVYFSQFIGVEKSSGDTIRILAPCQQFFMKSKSNRIGTFNNWDNSKSSMNSAFEVGDIKDLKEDKKDFYIVFNRNNKILERKNFKTVFGSLSL